VRRFPAAQAARQRIPFNDVSDGVASSSTNGEAADLTRRRRRRRRPPSARAAKRRISRDEPHSTTSLTALSLSFTTATPGPQPATWPSNVLSVLQNRLTCHVLQRTAFIAGQSRGRPCRSRSSSVDVTYANTRCVSHLAAALAMVPPKFPTTDPFRRL